MPNSKSAIKRTRYTAIRSEINKRNKSRARTQQKNFLRIVSEGDSAAAAEQLKAAYSAVDKAWKKGVYPKNRANRIKSRLAKKLSSLAS
jgi:small subunit ribosomal protein S20